jgi:ribosomal subunit interface protein
MQVLVSSDHTVTSSENLAAWVTDEVTSGLERWADRITRVEVHLSGASGPRLDPTSKRCVMEAHLGGLRPIAVHDEADAMAVAIDACIEKLEHALAHHIGKLQETPGPSPIPRQIAAVDELQRLEWAEKIRRREDSSVPAQAQGAARSKESPPR